MRRIYLISIPFQQNIRVQTFPYHPVNFVSEEYAGRDFSYIIVPVIAESMQEGDTGKLIVMSQTDGQENPNLDRLKEELAACGLGEDQIEIDMAEVRESQDADLLLDLFRTVTGKMEDGACYYADITFGPKSFPMIQMAALSYAENILEDTALKGIYYQEVKRKAGVSQTANVYDMQVLYSLSSLMSSVRGAEPADRKAMLDLLIGREG